MRLRLRHLGRDERGMSVIYVGAGFLAFFTATTLAIDVGMLMTARSQAQNAADAGALSGAIALALDDFDNRSAGGPAVRSAVNAALENAVLGDAVVVEPGDVTFPAAPSGQFDRVRVTVNRTSERSNPLSTLISGIFGVKTVDMVARATAEAAPTMAMRCVRPFTIPDRWIENSVPPNDTFERYNNKGKVIANADEYPAKTDSRYDDIRFDSDRDKGTRITLRAGSGNNIQQTFYYSWKMPGAIGGAYYEDNIRDCNQSIVTENDVMQQEPGNMVGPTISGIADLIAQDPSAYWDAVNKRVVSPLGRSPRVFPIPLYNPDEYDKGKETGRNATLVVANWIGFFVESYSGNEVYGRITPILGIPDPNPGPAPENAFARAIRLVE